MAEDMDRRWLMRKLAILVKKNYGKQINTVLLPSGVWENLGRPARLSVPGNLPAGPKGEPGPGSQGLKVIPFDNPIAEPQMYLGWTPEEVKT